MNMQTYKDYEIRDASVRIDINYESNMGIYGDSFWSEISNGTYESVTFDFLENLHKSGYEYFIDIGAATGCMSLYAASTGLKVISVEPQEMVYAALEKNLELNPSLSSQVSLVYALVSKSQDQSSLSESFTPGAAGPIASGVLTSNSITIKQLLERCDPQSKVAIKIDIEGAEFPLLRDKRTIDSLSTRKPLIYIALHPGFKRPLKNTSSFLSRFFWRIQASRDVIDFYSAISSKANIYIASTNKKVNLIGLLSALSRDEKDYLLVF
jgi:FkbM family methyltransferase